MANLRLDSFDHYATANMADSGKWDFDAGMQITSADSKDGDQCLLFPASGGDTFRTTVFFASYNSFTGAWFKFTSLPTGADTYVVARWFGTSGDCLIVELIADGFLRLSDSTGPIVTSVLAINAGEWTMIDLAAFLDAAGSCSATVYRGSGAEVFFDETGLSSFNSDLFYKIEYGPMNSADNVFLDSIYLNNDVGSMTVPAHESFQCAANLGGDLYAVKYFSPISSGSTAWHPSSGSNLSCVSDALPDGDGSYVQYGDTVGDTNGAKDLFTLQPTGLTGSVGCCQFIAWAKETDDIFDRLFFIVRIAGTTYTQPDLNVGISVISTYNYGLNDTGSNIEVNPATGLPFDLIEIDASQWGYQYEGEPPFGIFRVSQFGMEVVVTSSSPAPPPSTGASNYIWT